MGSATAADAFLTAYDPLDLPGGSVDPLGFDRGYGFLAELFLPGLTNAADSPRYFGLLCAGIDLAGSLEGLPPRRQFEARSRSVLHLERLWALAHVLQPGDPASDAPSLRGVSYARGEGARLRQEGATRSDGRFTLLKRQARYGVLGFYATVGANLRIVQDSRELSLTPDLGARLAEAFLVETRPPTDVYRSVKEGGEVSLDALAAWGERILVSGRPGPREAECLHEALHGNPLRSRASDLLRAHPYQPGVEEVVRLKRILNALEGSGKEPDIAAVLRSIVAFEDCYRHCVLALERLLMHAAEPPDFRVTPEEVAADIPLTRNAEALPKRIAGLQQALASLELHRPNEPYTPLADLREFLNGVAADPTPRALAEAVMRRHADVQRGKFDGGRSKSPWLEPVKGGWSLTTSRKVGLGREVTKPGDIRAHAYRVTAADNLAAAARGR